MHKISILTPTGYLWNSQTLEMQTGIEFAFQYHVLTVCAWFFLQFFNIQISFNIMFWQMPSGQTFQMRLIFFILFNFFSSIANIYTMMFWQVPSGQTFRGCQIFSNFIFVTIFQIQIFRTFRTLNVTFWFSTPDPARQVLKLTVSRKLFGTIASRKGQI